MPTKYALKCVIALICIFILTACENGKQPQLVTTVTNLANFEQGSGIERISLSHPLVNSVYHIYSKNLESKYLIPDVRSQLNNLPSKGTHELFKPIGTERTEIIAEKFQGEVMLSGESFQITSYRDVDSHVRVYFAHKDTELLDIMTYGSRISGTLPTGEITYRGANLLTIKNDDEIYQGEFQLQLNFDERKGYFEDRGYIDRENFAIASLNDGRYLVLIGEFDINLSSGTFSSDLLTLQLCSARICQVIGTDGQILEDFVTDTTDASIHGSLLGEEAIGIAAIYHDNSESPTYIGAIIGANGPRSSN